MGVKRSNHTTQFAAVVLLNNFGTYQRWARNDAEKSFWQYWNPHHSDGSRALGLFQRGTGSGASVRNMQGTPLIIFGFEPICSLRTASEVTLTSKLI